MARNRLPPPLLLAMLVAISIGDASGDAYDTSICKPYICGKLNISYPFYLSNQTADVRGTSNSYCGYPGLGIECVDGKYPMLKLDGDTDDDPYNYNVTRINGSMSNFTISLVDPEVLDDESCPWIDHNVTVPSFMRLMNLAENTTRYLVFLANCSAPEFFVPGQPAIQIEPIGCASSGGGKSFVVPYNVPYQTLSQQCHEVFLAPVVQNTNLQTNPYWNVTVYRNILNLGFQLEVNSSRRSAQCSKCEGSNNGRCAYTGEGEFVGCLCDNGQVEEEECPSDDDDGNPFCLVVLLACFSSCQNPNC